MLTASVNLSLIHICKYQQRGNDHFGQRTEQSLLETFIIEKKDQPIATSSEDFNEPNYGLIAYYKASQWMALLEKQLGLSLIHI